MRERERKLRGKSSKSLLKKSLKISRLESFDENFFTLFYLGYQLPFFFLKSRLSL